MKLWLHEADGLTISGGEPLDQAVALREFLRLLRDHWSGDVLLFSGYPHELIFERHHDIVSLIDVLISEPFDPTAGTTLDLRGSDNQRVFLLSELAHARYPANIDRRQRPCNHKLDVVFEGNNVWMAGIPQPGDMTRVRRLLKRRGFGCQTSDQPPFEV